MTEKVGDLAQKTEEIPPYDQELEFLSLSCPRASEYVLRRKKINEEEVICQRGNVTILDEFFNILRYAKMEELKLHILEIGQEDLKVFKKYLEHSTCYYKTKSIAFNQSADPQLIIDFAVKCRRLESLLVRGYNLKYPCKKTDYLIKVYTSDMSMFSDFRHVQRRPYTDEIVKSQVPLMCRPLEWSFEERAQLLTEKIPESLLNAGFMHNSEFFFADPSIKSIVPPRNSVPIVPILKMFSGSMSFPLHSSMVVVVSEAGVFCKVPSLNFGLENVCFDSLRLLCQDSCIYREIMDRFEVERTLRVRSLLYQSDEERDFYVDQKELLDMPDLIIDKILGYLTFTERLHFRGSCSKLYTYRGSQKHVVEDCKFSVEGLHATVEGDSLRCRVGEAKQLLATISKNSYIECFFMDTIHGKPFEKKELIEQLENIEPIRVKKLRVEINRDTYEASMKFIVEKCEGRMDRIELLFKKRDFDFKERDLEKILSARRVDFFTRFSSRCATKLLEAFVERAIVSGDDCECSLHFDLPDDRFSLESFQEKYSERIISTSLSPESSTLRIRTEKPTKHIVIEVKFSGYVIQADFVEQI